MSRYLNVTSQAADKKGKSIDGATLSFFEAGPTTTFLGTFQDEDLTIPNTNPVVADGQGRFPDIWLKPQKYYVEFRDADGVLLDAQDNVTGLTVSGATTLANIAALTALVKSSLLDGEVFQVDGYFTQGDSGGGDFFFDATSTVTANGGTVIITDEGGTGRWIRIITGIYIDLKWFGAKVDGTTVDNVAAQAWVTYITTNGLIGWVPTGVCKITATLTTANLTALRMAGTCRGNNEATTYPCSTFIFTGAGTNDEMFSLGENAQLDLNGIKFDSSDNTQQWGAIGSVPLGSSSSLQGSGASLLGIRNCSFVNYGGLALSLGGEWFGEIRQVRFHDCAQYIALNGAGEVHLDNILFEKMNNSGYTPVANNSNALVYIADSVVRVTNCVTATSVDFRDIFHFENCISIQFEANKMERPGLVLPTKHIVRITNTSIICKFVNVIGCNFVTSSASGAVTGVHIATFGTANQIYVMNIEGNTFSYSPGVDAAVTHIDVTGNKPRELSLGRNFREASDNPMITFADGATSLTTQQFVGISGASIEFVTVRGTSFTILAAQSGAIANLGGSNALWVGEDELALRMPVAIEITADSVPADTVDFFVDRDTSKLDKTSFTASEVSHQTRFALRTVYLRSPDQVIQDIMKLNYDSGASASTAVNYVVTFTYAIVKNSSTSRFDKGLIDIV